MCTTLAHYFWVLFRRWVVLRMPVLLLPHDAQHLRNFLSYATSSEKNGDNDVMVSSCVAMVNDVPDDVFPVNNCCVCVCVCVCAGVRGPGVQKGRRRFSATARGSLSRVVR